MRLTTIIFINIISILIKIKQNSKRNLNKWEIYKIKLKNLENFCKNYNINVRFYDYFHNLDNNLIKYIIKTKKKYTKSYIKYKKLNLKKNCKYNNIIKKNKGDSDMFDNLVFYYLKDKTKLHQKFDSKIIFRNFILFYCKDMIKEYFEFKISKLNSKNYNIQKEKDNYNNKDIFHKIFNFKASNNYYKIDDCENNEDLWSVFTFGNN